MSESREPSQLFLDSFRGGGGCSIECACGRVHFDNSEEGAWTWDDGELEHLRERAAADPGCVIAWAHCVEYVEINGQTLVVDCACGLLRNVEDVILRHAEEIAKYLNGRAEQYRVRAAEIEVTVPPDEWRAAAVADLRQRLDAVETARKGGCA